MIAYQYDAQGHYVGETDDYGGPLPNNSTRDPVDIIEGFWPRWTGTAWEFIEDHRGKTYWKPDEYEAWHEGKEVKDLGPLPADVSLVKPEMPEDVRLERAAQAVRDERDRRLAACDYLMMPDYPLGEAERSAWAAYRQELRDLPAQAGFPWSGLDDPTVPWPVEPV